MNFGEALHAIKAGLLAQRSGWNGTAMFVYLNRGCMAPEPVSMRKAKAPPKLINGIYSSLFDMGPEGTITRMPNFYIQTPNGSIATWVPTITDCLAEDWCTIVKQTKPRF